MEFPKDEAGDVLRRMAEYHFDFDKPHVIEFNVDFNEWPPATEAIHLLKKEYTNIHVVDPETDESGEVFGGYIIVGINSEISHEFVVKIQNDLSKLMSPFGGNCNSWGVMQE